MTQIIVLCDGTWNNRDRTKHPTSIARLSSVLEKRHADGDHDIAPKYLAGVGARDNLRGLRRTIDKWRGGALGRGLALNIRMGYRHIIRNYRPGDEIYIFGFSRGAYTARSLAGLVRSAGIVKNAGLIKKAFRRYRDFDEETAPKTLESLRFRARHSPRFYTNEAERQWRVEEGITPGDPIKLAYLGIFDTVGTNGIPGVLDQFGIVRNGHGFHDHELSSMVQSGRHAVGLDERRALYGVTPWSNLPELNRLRGQDGQGGDPFQQKWFPGEHGIIGGSGANRRISNSVLDWILEGAARAGLEVALPQDIHAKPDDYDGALSNVSGFDPTAWVKQARDGPRNLDALDDLHETAMLRLIWRAHYRPKSLRHFLRINAWRQSVEARLEGADRRFAAAPSDQRPV